MTTNDNRAIVQRARRVENTNQQVVTELGIELNAAISHILQSDIAFNHDQRAGLCRSECGRGQNDLVVNTLAKLPNVPRKRNSKTISERDQSLANFRLKQDDDRDTDVQQSVAEHELECGEVLFDGKPVEENQEADSGGHR